ncbi:MAG: hypothetical protein ACYTE8_12275 [Planctomycetota bacterium]|jgi:hypothetical protein
MYDTLKKIKDNDKIGDYLFPSLGAVIQGKIVSLSDDMVVVSSKLNDETFEYATHPNNIVLVQRK